MTQNAELQTEVLQLQTTLEQQTKACQRIQDEYERLLDEYQRVFENAAAAGSHTGGRGPAQVASTSRRERLTRWGLLRMISARTALTALVGPAARDTHDHSCREGACVAEWVDIQKDPQHMAREKRKAKELRQSQWWRNKIAQGLCAYCQQTFRADELTMDHIVPLARGGRSTRGNVVPCCPACNATKRYWTPADLLLQQLKAQESPDKS